MALRIADNFSYQGKLPNFVRDTFETLAEMKAYPDTSIDEGHISLCLEDGKRYKFLSTYTNDPTTGKWRKIIDSVLDITSENPIQNKVVTEKFNEIELSITNQIKALQTAATLQYKELTNTLEELDFLITTINTSIDNRINNNEEVISAALTDLEKKKLDSTTTINGHEIGSGLDLTKSDIGLGNVDNTSDANKPVSSATSVALNEKVDKKIGYSLVNDNLITKLEQLPTNSQLTVAQGAITETLSNHVSDTNNPHNVTAAQVGLGDYSSYTPSTLPVSNPQLTELNKKVNKTFTINGHDLSGNSLTLVKADLVLGNVDNTSDLDKPISTATQEALNELTDSTQEALDTKADDYLVVISLNNLKNIILDNEATVAAVLHELQQRILKLETYESEE